MGSSLNPLAGQDLDEGRPVIFLGLGVALLGGLTDAWLRFNYRGIFQPEKPFEWTLSQAPRRVFIILGAGVGANGLPTLL